ncbi:MAG: hypothetical protein KC493_05010 [Bacteriovoracaceae bacterium]|nr:hypothetical protein [Bacteriovoracaceae bacterium]
MIRLSYKCIGTLFLTLIFSSQIWAKSMCNKLKLKSCPWGSYSKGSGGSVPTQSGAFNFNPSSIPTDKGLGLEILNYNGDQDFAIVTGTGRIGAAISPSNYEDSFFGNMSFETSQSYLERKRAGKKYTSNKYSFATAFVLYDNKKKQSKTAKLNLGLIAKYNEETSKFNWGLGTSIELSVFTFGISKYKDDYYIYDDAFLPAYEYFERYHVDTYTVGVKLPHFIADVTYLYNVFDYYGTSYTDSIILVTGTFFWKAWMFTYGTRKEDSYRPKYNFETKLLETESIKRDTFVGIQYSINKHFIAGLYSNYYLNRGYTLGLTGFF